VRAQELAEVGGRLEDARQQEAKSRVELARLAQEMTTKTAELAQAEQRFQQAREAEASAHRAVTNSRREIEQNTARGAELEGLIRTLGADRDRLAAEVQRAEQQRNEARVEFGRLTEETATRTKQLQQMNDRLAAGRFDLETAEQTLSVRAQHLAEVGHRLEDGRQQEAKPREELRRLAQEITTKTAELAQIEQRCQQDKEAETSARAAASSASVKASRSGSVRKRLRRQKRGNLFPQVPSKEV
jgi:chromosome segregation ATPase